jgi:hypothetical protein
MWLSREGTWTRSFDEACAFTTADAAGATEWPAHGDYDDIYVLAWDGEFEEMQTGVLKIG